MRVCEFRNACHLSLSLARIFLLSSLIRASTFFPLNYLTSNVKKTNDVLSEFSMSEGEESMDHRRGERGKKYDASRMTKARSR